MNEVDLLLIRLLAETDAAFAPMRRWSRPIPTVTYERRRDFATLGLPWRSGESGEAERKRASRAVEAGVDAGLVVSCRPRGAKTLFARLTDRGDRTARRLARLPGIEAGIETLREIVRLQGHPEAAEGGGQRDWIAETLLARCEYGAPGANEALLTVEVLAAPALCRFWIESNSDLAGHVYFRPMAPGLAALSSPPSIEPIKRRPSKAASALYDSAVAPALEALYGSAPRMPRELGFIPLPASLARKGTMIA